ncbi:potassium channel family protein [Agromyces binzhouensis]|uniref:Two pore domain potassium channel family protein n=1 Tax=Agromyces binzhouensis TaxID=1817495 RepID=A0A4Q2JTY4_9MICO|nr:potassium channel family protein [Agromyces binzhouensis]RXZ49810.1 two pore domain potassium channel family protein [Agromyces binzhouensis]
MSVLSVVAGVFVIALGLYEVFHTLLHPTGRGRVSHLTARSTWSLSSSLGRRGRTLAGPLAAVAVVALWAALQVVGWALVYLPFVRDGFGYSPGIDPARYPAIVEALYYSTVSMSTLGLGDVYPIAPWLRVVAPLQGLIGFALLTAAVSWFLQLYPALGRRRALALRIALIRRVDTAGHVLDMESATSSGLLDSLTADLAQTRVDLWQNAETYYFTEDEPMASLAAQLPYARHLAQVARRSDDRTVRSSGQMLEEAVDDYANVLRATFLGHAEDTEAVLVEFAQQHRQHAAAVAGLAGGTSD